MAGSGGLQSIRIAEMHGVATFSNDFHMILLFSMIPGVLRGPGPASVTISRNP